MLKTAVRGDRSLKGSSLADLALRATSQGLAWLKCLACSAQQRNRVEVESHTWKLQQEETLFAALHSEGSTSWAVGVDLQMLYLPNADLTRLVCYRDGRTAGMV